MGCGGGVGGWGAEKYQKFCGWCGAGGAGGPRGPGDRGPKHLVRITEERVEGLGRRHVCVLVHSWGVFYFSCATPPSQPVFPGVGRSGGVDSCGLVGAVRGGVPAGGYQMEAEHDEAEDGSYFVF